MVAKINEAIREMCKAHPHGRLGMAADLGMSIDQFHNHLYRKCGSRFFTLDELELMQELSGTAYFAEYAATRCGKLLVDIPQPDGVDNVDLYHLDMQVTASKGELAKAKIEAIQDGVIDKHERRNLTDLFRKTLRHQLHGFLGFMALYGVSDHAVDTFVSTRRSDARECAAPGAVACDS
ncbi:hypothetical protein KC222_14860 [Cedecea davisae]|uniref:Uncharacterized protein n=1 Tax=Cedecea davisae TaxID=158484 RepID=A0ABS6DJQ7_9ENTR|nr:YmfL family putative regulatory protein [Cedecea davisae]MBU4683292.1 hypothetical protein [Cedecea davisae]MBU4686756.1 hypothetical protein [Cedecea davisae]